MLCCGWCRWRIQGLLPQASSKSCILCARALSVRGMERSRLKVTAPNERAQDKWQSSVFLSALDLALDSWAEGWVKGLLDPAGPLRRIHASEEKPGAILELLTLENIKKGKIVWHFKWFWWLISHRKYHIFLGKGRLISWIKICCYLGHVLVVQ